ncbi:RHS repeat-associated core domain-containing protein [Pseudomonas putida]|uniref:RHS repeat-associated core domain-containing protein n=1 Tax=Pseudomonas putida TaxID=303 RepID=A0A6I6Y2K0_PSEPU|nr:RHS repeat-associated core domain-containing protein [Pseudomonas putida]QHG65848.1 RHS repeat-associated core domain-containing protein [Pseudomonas putida]
MHKAATAVLHANTPSVAVRSSADSPLLALRLLRHPDVPQARLLRTRTEADLLTRKTRVFGARPLRATPTAPLLPDATTVSGLDGQALERHTADGDTALALNDSAGRLLWAQNAQGTRNWSLYEAAAEGGRPLATFEQPAGGMPRQRERMLHAQTTSAERDRNLVGSIIKQFDNAGYLHTRSRSLTDQVMETQRRLLQVEAQLPDWAGGSESELEPSSLRMTACHDATGAVLASTNPAHVTLLTAYDISGAISETRLQQGNAQAVAFNAVQRRADGAPLSQAAGNGVIDTFTYSPTTQRLARHKTSRPAGHPLGALVICDLHYHYDPVGNLQALDDRSVDPQWHHNQQVSGVREYAYDTLYRLVHATGREYAVVGAFRTAAFSAGDRRGGRLWSRYREQYSYDDGDNLTTLSHNGGAGARSRKLVVTSQSNRALPDGLGLLPETGFLAGGLQKLLAAGRPLAWQADNQLREVCLVDRSDGEADDREHYHYADGSTRTRKITTLSTAGAWQKIITTYLQGLELRQRLLANQPLPHKDVVISETAGLRWVHDRLGDEIHLRYSFSDHLGSVGGETDRSGKLVTREEYAPFGETTGLDETASEADALIHRTWRYSGKERDATGLYYYGWRYYQPGLARWLSADPGGTVDGLNLYRMVRNNPVRNRDDRGLVGEDASTEPDFWAFLDPNEHWMRYVLAINLIYGSHALINTAIPILDSLIHAGRAADRWHDVPRRVVADLRRQARTRLGAVGMMSIAARIAALTLTTISAVRRYHSEDPVAGLRLVTAASLMQIGTTYLPAFSESYGFYIHVESRRTRRPSEDTPDLNVPDPEDPEITEMRPASVGSASGGFELQQFSGSTSPLPGSFGVSLPDPHLDSAHSSLSGTAIRRHCVGQDRSRSPYRRSGHRQKRYLSL